MNPASPSTRRYWLLFATQAAGAAIVIWRAMPIFQRLLSGESTTNHHLPTTLWALLAVALMQPAFWWNLRTPPPVRRRAGSFAGYVLLFLSRMIFVLMAGLFSVVFYIRQAELIFAPWREGLLLLVLFSTFCFTQEMERLARALMEPPAGPRP